MSLVPRRSALFMTMSLLMAPLAVPREAPAQRPPFLASAPEPSLPSEPQGDAIATQPTQTEAYDLWTTKKLTGDWGGLRGQMEDLGFSIALSYQDVFQVNTVGGRETKNGYDSGGSYILGVEFDFEKMKLLPGGSFFMEVKGTWGGEASGFDREKIGGLFNTNQIAGTEEPIFVNKWWYRQRFLDDRIETRLGVIESFKDLFDISLIAGSDENQFLNRALISNTTIPHRTGMGAYINVWPTDTLYVRAAVIDAEFRARRTGFDSGFHDDAHFSAFWEFGYTPKFSSPKGTMPGRYRIGSWYDPTTKTRFRNTLGGALSTKQDTGDVGLYLGVDQMIWKENNNAADDQGLSVFARYGFAHGDVNFIEHHWSAGAQYVGLVPNRDKDTLGFGVAQSILSRQFRSELDSQADRETVYEMYYSIQLTPWCVISPDLQMVTNPGGRASGRDTFIGGLRVRIFF